MSPVSLHYFLRNIRGLDNLRLWVTTIIAFFLVSIGTANAKLSQPIRYSVRINDPSSQYVEVSVEIPQSRKRRTQVNLPAWTPGSYLIREFARHVYQMRAETLDGQKLGVHRLDKLSWEIANKRQGFRIKYQVFADELSVRTSFLGDKMALLNGTSLFFYVEGKLNQEIELNLELIHPSTKNWSIYTSLTPSLQTNGYRAPSYDVFVDSPILLGQAESKKFFVGLTQFEYVVLAPSGSNANVDRLANEAKSFVTSFAKIMSGLPFSKYYFLVVLDEAGSGGLEHLTSTAMILPPWGFDQEKGYQRARNLGAHEFFHAWNVKRIHDRQLGPFDYTRENYSDLLWFHEGFTETMEAIALLRSGQTKIDEFLDELAEDWNDYTRRPGRNHTSIAQLSRDAWIKYYRPAANHRNTTISYYQKGKLLGVLLDLELRLRSRKHGKQGSLENLFRNLWSLRPKNATEVPITRNEIIAAASREAGEDMHVFFDQYVYGTEEIDLPSRLRRIGVTAESQLPQSVETPKSPRFDHASTLWTGIVGEHSQILSIDPNSPAAHSGLMINDEIVAIDHKRVDNLSELGPHLAPHRVGEQVEISVFRRNRLCHHTLRLEENPYRDWTFQLELPENLNEDQLQLRDDWLTTIKSRPDQPHATN